MRVSIVIAAHNEGESLQKTVAAIVQSSVGLDYEIDVADDASADHSAEEMLRRFPQVRVVRHKQRRGASPTKDLGARAARGEVLVFLDGHTNPQPGAILQLVEDVERVEGRAIVTPTVEALDVERWKNSTSQVGHGYRLDLEQFDCGWLPLGQLRQVRHKGRTFHESPALIGCALAVHRDLYDELGGFDPQMRFWGVEDLDFGLKCWLMGFSILHDAEAVVGHRFRESFDNYDVPIEHLVANQLRMARKSFTHSVWSEWVDRCRRRHSLRLTDHPEGLWARVWQLFEADRPSVEEQRAHLQGRRQRDEFWYAERFGLTWPRLEVVPLAPMEMAFEAMAAEPSASPSPPPVTVTFDEDPVRTGYTDYDDPATNLDIKMRVTATVEPVSEVGNITIASGGPTPNRIEIENFVTFPNAGKIQFDVKGKRATPDNRPNGDTTIEAKKGDSVCGKVQAIVLVPRSLTPFSEEGDVTGVNQAADASTSPAYFDVLAPGAVHLWTYHDLWMMIYVADQFGSTLAYFYEGADVSESIGKMAINQKLSSWGSYQDPVGSFRDKPEPPPNNVQSDSDAAREWVDGTEPVQSILTGTFVQNIPVSVGGHKLIPGIVNRTVITTDNPPHVNIIWPQP